MYDDTDFVLANRNDFRFEILPSSYVHSLEALQDDLLGKIQRITELAARCSAPGGACEFSEEDFSHPYYYRIWLPLPAGAIEPRPPLREWLRDWQRRPYYQKYRDEVTNYYVRDPVRKKCLANKGTFGCITNAQIDHYGARVTLYTDGAGWIRDD